MTFEPSLCSLEQQRHTHVNPHEAIHTKSREEERTLTSDQLGALHNVSVRVVDGDFESCNTREEGLINHSGSVPAGLSNKLQSKHDWKPVLSSGLQLRPAALAVSATASCRPSQRPPSSLQQSSDGKSFATQRKHFSELALAAGGRCGRNKLASLETSHVILEGNDGTSCSPQTYPRSGGLCSQE